MCFREKDYIEKGTSAGVEEAGGTSTGPFGRLRGGMLIASWDT